jgi:hypothetical protein
VKTLLKFAGMQYLVCLCVSYNYRALARADVWNTAVSDALFSGVNYLVVRRIAKEDDSIWAAVGYAIGNIAGSVTAIYLTKLMWGN